MLRWAMILLPFAVIASILGSGGLSHGVVGIAKALCVVFLAAFLITGVSHLRGARL